MRIVPISFREAAAFVQAHHRHNKAPRGMKFCLGLTVDDVLVGVAVAGRPSARALDDGLTLEVTRTCTTGVRNANSALYGAIRRAAQAMGYVRIVTYTQAQESGASLRAVGFRRVAELKPRKSWKESTADPRLRLMRDNVGNGNVARVRWEWP